MDGQIAFAQDTESYYRYILTNFWVALLGGADITAVTITTASDSVFLEELATSGDFTATLLIDANNLATATATATDYLVIEDVTDGSTKKVLIQTLLFW